MCGIAGAIAGPGQAPDREAIARITRALAHRGPDSEGIVVDGPVAFGHRRLSVIDLSATSNQPMRDTSGRWLMVFNGEIYNYQALRDELMALGHRFATQGDSEVLLEALKAWGPAAVEKCLGMFAFALWDTQARRLILGRDRLGKKPMFYVELPGGGLAFASEPRALAVHPAVGGRIDPVALAQYLRLNYVPNHRSLFQGVRSLPPATVAEFQPGGRLQMRQYWDLAACFHDKRRPGSVGEAAEELRALVDDAVRIRLVSDVPLGAFLSGGVDSSTIVASMLQQREPASILTFTSGFKEDSFDESPLAEQLAAQFGLTHRTQTLDPASLDLLPAVIATAGEPLADTSALPMYFLSRFTRQSVTVALSGDGGDECFAGYETYVADRIHRMASVLPRGLRGSAHGVLDRLLPVDHKKLGLPEKLRRFSAALAQPFERAHASWRDIFREPELAALMRGDWRARVGGSADGQMYEEYFAPHFAAVKGCHALDQATYVDIKTWMVDDVLVKADRTSMANSLEVRCPLLDHRVVEFAARLPPEMKLRGFDKKHVLKLSQRGRLPDELLNRKKAGFNAPLSQWLLGPLRGLAQDVLHSAPMREWFDDAALQALWRQHERMERDNGLKLFGLLTVGLFLRSAHEAAQPAAPALSPAPLAT
jgi:asparagine synthase (glutamine-hydrolysing)